MKLDNWCFLYFSHKSYRPLTILTFRLENYFYGLNPLYMKIVNLILHSLCCCLLYNTLFSIFRCESISFNASLLFAVHPIHTEVVSGIVGRAELLSGIALLLSLNVFTKPNGKLKKYIYDMLYYNIYFRLYFQFHSFIKVQY